MAANDQRPDSNPMMNSTYRYTQNHLSTDTMSPSGPSSSSAVNATPYYTTAQDYLNTGASGPGDASSAYDTAAGPSSHQAQYRDNAAAYFPEHYSGSAARNTVSPWYPHQSISPGMSNDHSFDQATATGSGFAGQEDDDLVLLDSEYQQLDFGELDFDQLDIDFDQLDYNQANDQLGQMPSVPAFPDGSALDVQGAGDDQMTFASGYAQPNHNHGYLQTEQADIEDVKQALKQPFPVPGSSYSLHCQSEADFRAKFRAYLTLCDPAHDPDASADFPTDNESQKRLVRELVAAMIYLGDDCLDRDSKTPVNRLKKLAPLEFDLMAWTVLFECRDIQQGKLSMPRWGSDWDLQHFDSFQARFDSVKAALAQRKSMVASCFDHVFSKRLVINPTKEERQKRSNKDVNAKRAVDLGLAKRMRDQQNHGAPPRSQRGNGNRASGRAGSRAASKASYRTNTSRQNSAHGSQAGATIASASYQLQTPVETPDSGVSPENMLGVDDMAGLDPAYGAVDDEQYGIDWAEELRRYHADA